MLALAFVLGREGVSLDQVHSLQATRWADDAEGAADLAVLLNPDHRDGAPPVHQAVMTGRGVILNELAQGLRLMSQESSGSTVSARRNSPRRCCSSAITDTPAVLITRGRIDQQPGKIAGLAPLDERRTAFRLLIAVLAIADARRRERYCSDGCGHWWHRLSAVNPT